jgi:hypothetical protein
LYREPKLLESLLEASGLVALAVVLTIAYYKKAFLKTLLKKHYGLIVFAVVLTVIYCLCYHIVASNPQIFLTEGSITTYTRVPSSNGTSITVPLSQSASGTLTHWSWLNYANQKYVIDLALFFVAVFLCSYFKPASVTPLKHESAKKARQRLLKAKIENAFAVFGIFTAEWSFTLIFVPLTLFDSVLTLILVFAGVILLVLSGIYVFLKRQEIPKKGSVGNALTYFGVFLVVCLVTSTFLGTAYLSILCLLMLFLVSAFFIAKISRKLFRSY